MEQMGTGAPTGAGEQRPADVTMEPQKMAAAPLPADHLGANIQTEPDLVDDAVLPGIEPAVAAVDVVAGDAVRLVSPQEKLVHRVGPSEFYYRRIPSEVRNRLLAKHTKKGDTDWPEYAMDCLRWGLLGWKNVLDYNGDQLVFDRSLCSVLPAELQTEMQDLMGASVTKDEDRVKNS